MLATEAWNAQSTGSCDRRARRRRTLQLRLEAQDAPSSRHSVGQAALCQVGAEGERLTGPARADDRRLAVCDSQERIGADDVLLRITQRRRWNRRLRGNHASASPGAGSGGCSRSTRHLPRRRYPRNQMNAAGDVTGLRWFRVGFAIRSRAVKWSTGRISPLWRPSMTSFRRTRRPSTSRRASASPKTQSSSADRDTFQAYCGLLLPGRGMRPSGGRGFRYYRPHQRGPPAL